MMCGTRRKPSKKGAGVPQRCALSVEGVYTVVALLFIGSHSEDRSAWGVPGSLSDFRCPAPCVGG